MWYCLEQKIMENAGYNLWCFFLVFFFVGDVSEKRGPEWLLTYDSQQYDRYLCFLIFLGVSPFLFPLIENIRCLEDQPESLSNNNFQTNKCYEMHMHPRNTSLQICSHLQKLWDVSSPQTWWGGNENSLSKASF